MSEGRSGYDDYEHYEQWDLIRWRGAVKSALRGKRGQAFLREMLAALDALSEPRLIAGSISDGCGVCALGSVAAMRRMDFREIPDPYEYREGFAAVFGIADAMAAEIMYVNDEGGLRRETDEERFRRVRGWIESKLRQAE